ncbi:MAG: tetratricopeptide repeat protein [Proteobacteria bacterium]|nr:tetratricopeptide repeat protein [Pseudomonadota bacterium]MBU1399119.1 tetratricopeptide repeat protein [Pseudomonadota bacterium]
MRQYYYNQINAVGGDDMFMGRVIVIILMILSLPFTSMAISREFIENYTYSAGESDSKLTCRMFSLIEIKRMLLEKIGTYLESRTEIKDFQIEKDEIIAFTAGIVKLEILDEKWNGEKYSLTAKIEADPEDITKAINNLRNQHDKMENIRKLKEFNDDSLEQIREMQFRMQQLQSDILRINQDANANKSILNAWGLYEKAVELRQSGKTKEAIEALNTVIQNNPTHLAYLERGMAYEEMERYDDAIADLTEVLKAQPNMRGALWARGKAYNKSGNKGYGRRDIEKSAELGNGKAKKWLEDHPGGGGSGKRKSKQP